MKRLHRLLLRMYPKEFREEYGREIQLAFEDRLREGPVLWSLLESVWGMVGEAPLEHGRLLADDLRHAWRKAKNEALVSGAIILTLGMAIGINISLFTLVDGLLIRPGIGINEPERVVRVYGKDYWTAMTRSYPDYLDLREGVEGLEAVAAYQRYEVLVQGRKQRVNAVSAGYFQVARARPAKGGFDGTRLGEDALVVAEGFARREWGGVEQAIGKELRLGRKVYRVIGVCAGAFRGFDDMPVELWTGLGELPRDRGNFGAVHLVARLADGVPMAVADRQANAANLRGWRADGVKQEKEVMQLGPYSVLRGPKAPKEVSLTLWLAALSLIVLVIGCANVAQILLARAVRARRERVVQLALGASFTRILRQSAMEGMLIAVAGGVFALALAYLVSPVVAAWLLPFAEVADFELGWSALAVAALAVGLAGLISGMALGWEAVSTRNSWSLRHGSEPHKRGWLRGALAGTQVAFTTVLLVGAGLLVRSLNEVYRLEPGLALEEILVVRLQFMPGRQGWLCWWFVSHHGDP